MFGRLFSTIWRGRSEQRRLSRLHWITRTPLSLWVTVYRLAVNQTIRLKNQSWSCSSCLCFVFTAKWIHLKDVFCLLSFRTTFPWWRTWSWITIVSPSPGRGFYRADWKVTTCLTFKKFILWSICVFQFQSVGGISFLTIQYFLNY